MDWRRPLVAVHGSASEVSDRCEHGGAVARLTCTNLRPTIAISSSSFFDSVYHYYHLLEIINILCMTMSFLILPEGLSISFSATDMIATEISSSTI